MPIVFAMIEDTIMQIVKAPVPLATGHTGPEPRSEAGL